MRKTPYQVQAFDDADSLEEAQKIAIREDKSIPFKSPNGKIWLVRVDDAGALTVTEKT